MADNIRTGLVTERHCQQWTAHKLTFAMAVWKSLGINSEVLIAWMAVESGGALDRPNGGHYNYLQIKGPVGFASYPNAVTAARAAVRRIKAEPAIMKAIRKRSNQSTLMTAIAVAWDDGSGRPKNIPKKPLTGSEAEYRQRLEDKHHCIDGYAVSEDFGVVGGPNGVAQYVEDLIAAGEEVGEKLDPFGWIDDHLWPILLQSAGVATGLALIGYGITQLAKSPSAGEHARRAAPIAAEVAS